MLTARRQRTYRKNDWVLYLRSKDLGVAPYKSAVPRWMYVHGLTKLSKAEARATLNEQYPYAAWQGTPPGIVPFDSADPAFAEALREVWVEEARHHLVDGEVDEAWLADPGEAFFEAVHARWKARS
jgi:hypothetical protein